MRLRCQLREAERIAEVTVCRVLFDIRGLTLFAFHCRDIGIHFGFETSIAHFADAQSQPTPNSLPSDDLTKKTYRMPIPQ